MRKVILIIKVVLVFSLGFVSQLNAQKYYLTNQYAYDLFQLNPAAAAFQKNTITVNSIVQTQWMGMDEHPGFQTFSLQMPVMDNLGSGTYVYNDRNGYYSEFGIHQSLSYEVLLKKTKRNQVSLTMGLGISVEQSSLNTSKILDDAYFDPIVNGGKQVGWGINASFGALLKYNDTHLGIAVTNLMPQTNDLYKGDEEPSLVPDLNIHLGSTYKVPDRDLYIEPLLMYRRNLHSDSRLDLNMKVYMPTPDPDWSVWGIMSYRRTMDHRFGKSLGIAPTIGVAYKNLSIGFEYQLGTTGAQTSYGSSYQVILSYRIFRDNSKSRIPCSKIRGNKKHNYKHLGY